MPPESLLGEKISMSVSALVHSSAISFFLLPFCPLLRVQWKSLSHIWPISVQFNFHRLELAFIEAGVTWRGGPFWPLLAKWDERRDKNWGCKFGMLAHFCAPNKTDSNFEVVQTKVHFLTPLLRRKTRERYRNQLPFFRSTSFGDSKCATDFFRPFLAAFICPVNTNFLPINPSHDIVVPYANLSLECLKSTFKSVTNIVDCFFWMQ